MKCEYCVEGRPCGQVKDPWKPVHETIGLPLVICEYWMGQLMKKHPAMRFRLAVRMVGEWCETKQEGSKE